LSNRAHLNNDVANSSDHRDLLGKEEGKRDSRIDMATCRHLCVKSGAYAALSSHQPCHSPEKGAVTKITTKIVKPNAKAMLRSAVVLLRKHEPGTAAGQECTESETTWSQRRRCIAGAVAEHTIGQGSIATRAGVCCYVCCVTPGRHSGCNKHACSSA